MEDQVKFTNKLMDAKVLIIGGSSGMLRHGSRDGLALTFFEVSGMLLQKQF